MSWPPSGKSPRTDYTLAGVAGAALFCAITVLTTVRTGAAPAIERLSSSRGVPAFLAGQFEDAAGYARRPDGSSLVFDRRRHRVFTVNAARTAVATLVEIGYEVGRVLRPLSFDVAMHGGFVVADAPGRQPRISVFDVAGRIVNAFALQGTESPRITVGNVVLNGVGAARYTGVTVLISQPERGLLVSEYSVTGAPQRQFGTLRPTGHEGHADIHLAFNSALPLPTDDGGAYVVFLAGEPAFRKYSATGALEFERAIQGREIDPLLLSQPTQWARRSVDDVSYPLVRPTVRTAAVDRQGRLWVAMVTSQVYVFDRDGEKIRTLQLVGAGVLTPESMWFTRDGALLVTPGLFEFAPPFGASDPISVPAAATRANRGDTGTPRRTRSH